MFNVGLLLMKEMQILITIKRTSDTIEPFENYLVIELSQTIRFKEVVDYT